MLPDEEVQIKKERDSFFKVVKDHSLNDGLLIGCDKPFFKNFPNQNLTQNFFYIQIEKEKFVNFNKKYDLPSTTYSELIERSPFQIYLFKDGNITGISDSSDIEKILTKKFDYIFFDIFDSPEIIHNILCMCFSLLKEGGIIGGRKYFDPKVPWMKIAIDNFFKRFNWIVHQEGTNIWWVQEKSLNISFIIPAYLCSNTIEEAITSIVETNFETNDEIIIVYDLSPDDLETKLFELKNKYPMIKLIKHLFPRGGGVARNIAVENSRNELIFCLDSDNILAPFTIQKLKQFLIDSGSDVAAFREIHYFNQKISEITHKWQYKKGKISLADCLSGPIAPGASGNYLYTRNSWISAGGYPEFSFLDTWGFGFRQLATGSKMMVMENLFYFHRHGHDSYWVRGSKTGTTSLQALQIILPFLDLLDPLDVEYILSEEGRNTWYQDINKHIINVKNHEKGQPGEVIDDKSEVNKPNIMITIIKKTISSVFLSLGYKISKL